MRYMGIMSQCDELRFRTCREIEGPYADYVGNKPVRQICIAFRTSYTRAKHLNFLDEKWSRWLGEFEANSVIYCAFGSE